MTADETFGASGKAACLRHSGIRDCDCLQICPSGNTHEEEPLYSEEVRSIFDSFCLEGKITEQHAREIKNILNGLVFEK